MTQGSINEYLNADKQFPPNLEKIIGWLLFFPEVLFIDLGPFSTARQCQTVDPIFAKLHTERD